MKLFAVLYFGALVTVASITLLLSLAFAIYGEPQNYWLWHSILGVL
jgi:hypothetical protein